MNDFTDQIDLNLLRVFDALMRHRSVTAAARELGLTQSSTSNALDRLRRALDDRLLERQGNRMVPTRRAMDIWPALSEGLSHLRDGLAAAQHFDPVQAMGRFRIGLHDYAMAVLGPALIADLRAAAPQMDVDLLAVGSAAEDEMLHDGRLDLILRSVWLTGPGLESQLLIREGFTGLIAVGHPLAGLGPVALDDYLAWPHVLVSSRGAVPGNVDAALAPQGLRRRIGCSVPTFEAAARIVACTDMILATGTALAPQLAATHGLTRFDLPLDVPGFDLAMLWSRRSGKAPAHLWLRARVAGIAAALGRANPPSRAPAAVV